MFYRFLLLVDRCLDESSKDSQYWEEACDTSSREFGKRWLVYDERTGDIREPDGTEEVDSQVGEKSAPFLCTRCVRGALVCYSWKICSFPV